MPVIKQLVRIGENIGVVLDTPSEVEGSITIYDAKEIEEFKRRVDQDARKEGFTAGQISMQLDCESAALAQGFRLTKLPIRDIKSAWPAATPPNTQTGKGEG